MEASTSTDAATSTVDPTTNVVDAVTTDPMAGTENASADAPRENATATASAVADFSAENASSNATVEDTNKSVPPSQTALSNLEDEKVHENGHEIQSNGHDKQQQEHEPKHPEGDSDKKDQESEDLALTAPSTPEDSIGSTVGKDNQIELTALNLDGPKQQPQEKESQQSEPAAVEVSEESHPPETERTKRQQVPLPEPPPPSQPQQQQQQHNQQQQQQQQQQVHQHQQQLTPPRSAASASTEIVHSLFGPIVGLCWGDFSCQYNHVRGRLYASTEAVLFYSNIFGFERKIDLRYDDVLQMQLYRNTSIQISVLQEQENESSIHYIFKGFSDRVQTLQLLIDLWKQSQGAENIEAPAAEAETTNNNNNNNVSAPQPEVPSQEVVSKPSSGQARPPASQSPLGDEGNAAPAQQQPPNNSVPNPHPSILRPSKLSTTPPSRPISPVRLDTKTSTTSTTPSRLFPDLSSSSRKRSKSLPPLHRRKTTKRSQSLESTASSDGSQDDVDWNKEPSKSDLVAWNAVKKGAAPCIKEVGIKPTTFACSLETFFKLFLADNAPHSIDKYQRETVKDQDVKISPWKQDTSSSSEPNTLVRTITFRHPVSSSLGVGPSHAPTKKCQRLRRYPGCGMCLTSSTTVEGLPAAECFLVEDQWIIETGEQGATSSDNKPRVKLSAKFGAKFTKFTFLKGIIQKSISSGNIEWFDGYKRMVESTIKGQQENGEGAEAPEEETLVKDHVVREPGMAYSDMLQNLSVNKGALLVAAVVACQIVMLLFLFIAVTEMKRSHQTSETLLEEMKLLRLEHGQLLEFLLEKKSG